MLQPLPPSISGFFEPHIPYRPSVAPDRFLNYLSEGMQDYCLIDFSPNGAFPDLSYMTGLLGKGMERYLAFCNKYYPYLAFARINEPLDSLEGRQLPQNYFIDLPDVKEEVGLAFVLLGKQVLTARVDSDLPFSAHMVSCLTDEEFGAFSYWEPRIMADIIFNNWKKD